MKILWLTPQFPSNNKSIKGIYLYRTVRYLSKYFDIETWCFYPSMPPAFNMIKKPAKALDIYKYWKNNIPKYDGNLAGIRKERLSFITYLRLPRAIFHFWEAHFILRAAKKNLESLKSDFVIYSNWIFPAGHLAYLLSKKYKVPYSVSLLGTDVHNLKNGTLYWKVAKKVLENADYITSVSQKLINRCINEQINIPTEKTILVDNIYDTDNFKIIENINLRDKYNIDSEKRIILYVGGLVEIKNVDVLINAFSETNSDNYMLIIAGTGSEESNLKNLADTSKNSDNILFVGNLQSETLINYYNLADVFCLPSKNEGTPNVIIEALLCGLPVVASNVGGIPDLIVNYKNGFLVEKNNVKSFAENIEKALSLKWDRNKIRNSVSRFFPENALKKYYELFSKLEKTKN